MRQQVAYAAAGFRQASIRASIRANSIVHRAERIVAMAPKGTQPGRPPGNSYPEVRISDDDLAAVSILARAGKIDLTASLDELAYPADGRVTLSALAARRALTASNRRALPEIPDYQRLPPEQAGADARNIASRLVRRLPV